MNEEMAVSMKKAKNKVRGFNVKVLDDGSFMMRTDNENYEMCKEYSFQNMDDLYKGMKEVMMGMKKGMKTDKDSDHEDMLEKKAEKY